MDFRWGEAGHLAGGGHGGECCIAIGVGLGEVVDVGCGAVSEDGGEDGCAAGAGGGGGFYEDECGSFAEGEAVAVGIEGAGDAGGAEGLEGIEAGEDELAEGVVSAREDAVGAAGADEVEGLADGVGTGGAGV